MAAVLERGGMARWCDCPALDETLTRDYLRSIASDTGGRIVFNTTNDIGIGFRRAWEDADSYYLIGYEPTLHRNKGRFRKVTLKVTRPDLDLLYRRGYFENPPSRRGSKKTSVRSAHAEAFDRQGFEVVTVAEAKRSNLPSEYHRPPFALRNWGPNTGPTSACTESCVTRKGALVGGKPLAGRDVALRQRMQERFEALHHSTDRLIVWLEERLCPPPESTVSSCRVGPRTAAAGSRYIAVTSL